MKDFKPWPAHTKGKIVCYVWGCGDDCYCQEVKIYFHRDGDNIQISGYLWDSGIINFEWQEPYYTVYLKELDSIRKRTIEACLYYDIGYKDLDSNCIWDWEFTDRIIDG